MKLVVSNSLDINVPLEEEFQKRGNFEWIILYILQNNPNTNIAWKTFKDAGIKKSTLSNKLTLLQSKNYIKKSENKKSGGKETNYYEITSQGRDHFYQLSMDQKNEVRKTNCNVPEIIETQGKHSHIILWMLNNNNFCKWNDFLEAGINQSTLSKNLNNMMAKEQVKKETISHQYFITENGKIEYKKMLNIFNLDKQSILEESKNRIEEITKKVNNFFQKYKISEKNIKYRFINKILKMDYSEIKDSLKDEERFYKILLFLTLNHPEIYPHHISMEKFSKKNDIKYRILNYFVHEIVEDNNDKLFPSTKFFTLNTDNDSKYFFQEDDKLERILRVIVEDKIFQSNFLHKLDSSSYKLSNNIIIDEIIKELFLRKIFDKGFNESLRIFLPIYIEYLKFKQEKDLPIEQKIPSDLSDRFKEIIWQSVSGKFVFESFEKNINADSESLLYNQKIDLLRLNSFKSKYFSENLENLELIKKQLENREYEKASEIFEKIVDQFNSIEALIIKDIINHYLKNYEESIKVTNEIIEKYPDDYIGYLLQGNTYYEKGDHEKGLKILERSLKIKPKHALLTYQKVLILNKRKEYVKSLNIIKEFLEDNPKNILFLGAKANVLESQEKFEEALDIYERALNLDENNVDLTVGKGIALRNVKKYDASIECLMSARKLEITPRQESYIYATIAVTYRALKEYEKSLDFANRAIELDSKYDNCYLTKALTLEKMGRYIESIEILDIAIKLNSKKNRYFIEKSIILSRYLNDFQGALKEINKGLKQNPEDVLLLEVKARNLLSLDKNQEALKIVNKALELEPDYLGLIIIKAIILFEMGNYNKGFSLIEKVIELSPETCIGYDIKSKFFGKINQYEKALDNINKVIDIHPEEITHKIEKIRILNLMGKYDEALIMINKYIEEEPDNPSLYNLKAFSLSRKGEGNESLKLIDRAIDLDPKNSDHYSTKASLLSKLKMYDEAFIEIEKLDSNTPDKYILSGELFRELEKYDKALEQLDKALQLSKKDLSTYFIKGEILEKLNDYNQALKQYDKILEISPNNPDAHSHKGHVYRYIEDFDKALIEFDKAISNNPNIYLYYGAKSAILCDFMGRFEDALKVINKGLKIKNDAKELITNKFVILLNMSSDPNKLQEVMSELNDFITDDPEFSKFYGLKSKVLFDLGKRNEAKILIKKGIKLNPQEKFNYQILIQNIKIYPPEEVLALIEQAILLNPDDLGLLNSKLYILARLNKEKEAIIIAERMIKMEPKEGNSYDSYGEVLLMFNKYDKALEMLNKAIEIDPHAIYLHETYIKIGECYFHMGNHNKALENLNKGKKLAQQRNKGEEIDKANKIIAEIKETNVKLSN